MLTTATPTDVAVYDPNSFDVPKHPQLAEDALPPPLLFSTPVEDSAEDAPKLEVPGYHAESAPPNLCDGDKILVKATAPVVLRDPNLKKGGRGKVFPLQTSAFASRKPGQEPFCLLVTCFSVEEDPNMTPENTVPVVVSTELGNLIWEGTWEGTGDDKVWTPQAGATNKKMVVCIPKSTLELLDGTAWALRMYGVDAREIAESFGFTEMWESNTNDRYGKNGKKGKNLRAKYNRKLAHKIRRSYGEGEREEYTMRDVCAADFLLNEVVAIATHLVITPIDQVIAIPPRFAASFGDMVTRAETIQVPEDVPAAVRDLQESIQTQMEKLHMGKPVYIYVGAATVLPDVDVLPEQHNEKALTEILRVSEGSHTLAARVAQVIGEMEELGQVKNFFSRDLCFATKEEADAFIAAQPRWARRTFQIIDVQSLPKGTEEETATQKEAEDEALAGASS